MFAVLQKNKSHIHFFLLFRALDAVVNMSWDNMHLKNILSSDTYCSHVPDNSSSGSFNSQGQPLWLGKKSELTYQTCNY